MRVNENQDRNSVLQFWSNMKNRFSKEDKQSDTKKPMCMQLRNVQRNDGSSSTNNDKSVTESGPENSQENRKADVLPTPDSDDNHHNWNVNTIIRINIEDYDMMVHE
ncbi:uncharacterized protein LOC128201046 [Galleria mellonella]|uniref:Uncharacterized protein LOC128201046 n=1 Tax=Galleria mellonella TaxID=7137 RepID=A0ABM3MN16_GALME|nr:uncharacterized protein LOC128201046 [Galleria mellonella]